MTEQAQNFFDPAREKRRGISFTRLSVVNRNTMHLGLPDGNLVPIGKHEVRCYEDNVKFVQALVEDPKRVARARDAYWSKIVAEVFEHVRNQPDSKHKDADPDAIAE